MATKKVMTVVQFREKYKCKKLRDGMERATERLDSLSVNADALRHQLGAALQSDQDPKSSFGSVNAVTNCIRDVRESLRSLGNSVQLIEDALLVIEREQAEHKKVMREL